MENIFDKIQQKNAERGANILKAFGEGETLEKGKKGNIGEIREWGGKKYKKQSNGKWVEVSERGMTKHEHNREIVEKQVGQGKSVMRSGKRNVTVDKKIQELSDIASKLSGKEHDESELSGEKEDEKLAKVVKYLKENNMTTTDRELNDAADINNYILSPRQKDKVKELFQKKK